MDTRRRIALLILLSATPLLAVSVYNAMTLGQEQRAQSERNTRQLAHTLATLQAEVLISSRQLLYGLAAGYEGNPERLFGPDCRNLLTTVVEGSALHANALIADTQGRIRCSFVDGKQVSIEDRDYFRTALSRRTFVVSAPIQGRVLGRQIVVAAQPVYDTEESVAALLLVSIETRRLAEVFQRAALPGDVVVSLLDRKGLVLARYPHSEDYVGQTLPAFRQLQDGAERAQGVSTLTGLGGVSRLSAYARLAGVPGPSLFVLAGIPEASIYEEANSAVVRSLSVAALTLLVALLIGLVGAQRLFIGPLRQLTDAAVRYGKGDLAARSGLSHEKGEVGTLATAFDELAEKNARATRALRALSAGNRTLLREQHEHELLSAMCRIVVSEAGYRLAFVNFAEHDAAKSIRTVARAGHDDGFIDQLKLTWADTERGRGSVGTAIRTESPCVVQSMAADPRFLPWREAAIARGYGSIASFPLRVAGEVIGTLSIIAGEPDAFDEEEFELLDEMAADLAFGIQVIRANAKRVMAEELAHRAKTHDPLTGLPGRIPFLLAVESALAQAAGGQKTFSILVLRIAALEDLQASLGYDATNFAVLEVGARLQSQLGSDRYLARIAADDFAVLLPGMDAGATADYGRRLHALLDTPVSAGAVSVDPRISVGATIFPAHGEKGELLLRRAALAADESVHRELGFSLYRGSSEQEDPERLALAMDLRRAIEERQLRLHYQPKVDLRSGEICGVEALARWQHAAKGNISPAVFVSIAERTGLIRQLTDAVTEQAIRQLGDWKQQAKQIPVAVNLSARNLHDPRLLEKLDDLLATWNVAPQLLHYEITEGALVEDPENARKVLQRLRELGGQLYIDDFGTGYSSLNYLVSLPVHAVKIDRSFVRQMTKSREAHSVVASVILMAHELGLRVIAEGVETAEEAHILRNLKCDEAQGYYFGRPVPPDQFRIQG